MFYGNFYVYSVRLSKQVFGFTTSLLLQKRIITEKHRCGYTAKESSSSEWREGDEDHRIKNIKKGEEGEWGREDSLDMAIGHCWRHVCWSWVAYKSSMNPVALNAQCNATWSTL